MRRAIAVLLGLILVGATAAIALRTWAHTRPPTHDHTRDIHALHAQLASGFQNDPGLAAELESLHRTLEAPADRAAAASPAHAMFAMPVGPNSVFPWLEYLDPLTESQLELQRVLLIEWSADAPAIRSALESITPRLARASPTGYGLCRTDAPAAEYGMLMPLQHALVDTAEFALHAGDGPLLAAAVAAARELANFVVRNPGRTYFEPLTWFGSEFGVIAAEAARRGVLSADDSRRIIEALLRGPGATETVALYNELALLRETVRLRKLYDGNLQGSPFSRFYIHTQMPSQRAYAAGLDAMRAELAAWSTLTPAERRAAPHPADALPDAISAHHYDIDWYLANHEQADEADALRIGAASLIAASAHTQESGAPPAALSDLVASGWLTAVPEDPLAPSIGWVYTRDPAEPLGFRLYSARPDEADDGGLPVTDANALGLSQFKPTWSNHSSIPPADFPIEPSSRQQWRIGPLRNY